MFGFFFGSWSSMEIYIVALYAMLFQLFPATRKSWLVALLLTIPFYLTFLWLLYNAPLPADRHGYGQLVLTVLVLPPIVGNFARGIGLFLQSKKITRSKALLGEFAVIFTYIAIVYFGGLDSLFEPFEYPEPNIQNTPLEKIQ